MRPRQIIPSLALVLAACRAGTAPSAELLLSALPASQQVAVGETVRVEVTLTNTSGHAVMVPGGPFAFLEVRDAQGRVVAFGRFEVMALIAYPPRSLSPGETLRDHAPWTGEGGAGSARAAPGVYHVRAAIPQSASRVSYLYSPTVEIRVVP